jgi:hypothetical protein
VSVLAIAIEDGQDLDRSAVAGDPVRRHRVELGGLPGPLAREPFDPPLSDTARQVVLGRIRRARQQLDELLDDDDLRTLDVLSDANDPRGVTHRGDVFVTSSRQIVVARPLHDT